VQVFLFTTLPTNELGLLARSLPIAHERAQLGHWMLYRSPVPAPGKVIAETGFENLLSRHSLFHSGFARVLSAGRGRGPEGRSAHPPRRLWLLPDRIRHRDAGRHHSYLFGTVEQRAAGGCAGQWGRFAVRAMVRERLTTAVPANGAGRRLELEPIRVH
jgi:hypothetical protein